MASFGSGLVRTARTINLDKRRDERHSVEAATELPNPALGFHHLGIQGSINSESVRE